ncbi:MAG TPA: HAMP domain-containing sensor histidine kinase, partial [Pedococcus sp.]|nr:HAMP domain-containing sensor histidine kinase [Pedococcus sp.]
DLVRQAAVTADDVNDPPQGVWLVRISGGSRAASPGSPSQVVGSSQLASARPGMLSVDIGPAHWSAWVADRGGSRFVAVYDQSRHRDEEHRLLVATTLAGLLGVLLAGSIGLLVGRRAIQPLGRALELQRRFVADASHELRTPLAVLNTRAQMIRRHLPAEASAEQRTEVDQLVGDTASLGEVVSDLLLAAQLEHTDLPARTVDLALVAREVVASMIPYADAAGVRLHLVGTENAAQNDFVVTGAPTALRRALTALVDNAIAHSQPGDPVRVRLRREPAGGGEASTPVHTVCLAVEDDGDGLEAGDASALTRRFARGAAASAGGGRRFGLGLALVDEVVRAHHGQLEITGMPGLGSTFTLRLPASRRGVPESRSAALP